MIADRPKRQRRLILFRHAKSDWPEGVADHERPLADRGRKAAPLMGAWLERHGFPVDLVLVSTARRAQETWMLASRAMKNPPPARNSREIYEASCERLVDVIHGIDGDVRTLMIVGHNPGLQDLACRPMKDASGEASDRLRQKFPTAAIAMLSFDIDNWRDIAAATGSLDRFVTPKSVG
jgi:phosphohistidine phosphatase